MVIGLFSVPAPPFRFAASGGVFLLSPLIDPPTPLQYPKSNTDLQFKLPNHFVKVFVWFIARQTSDNTISNLKQRLHTRKMSVFSRRVNTL
jgi:hypothetical protein